MSNKLKKVVCLCMLNIRGPGPIPPRRMSSGLFLVFAVDLYRNAIVSRHAIGSAINNFKSMEASPILITHGCYVYYSFPPIALSGVLPFPKELFLFVWSMSTIFLNTESWQTFHYKNILPVIPYPKPVFFCLQKTVRLSSGGASHLLKIRMEIRCDIDTL